ncbi:MAG: M48 family metallopeptidase [Opitutaceae bacterium]|nr:M48 family metallopeptidase [Opitutaceae bacterium]
MDFFEAQDRARRRTKRLVVLFVFAVLGIIVAGYIATMFALGQARTASNLEDSYWELQQTAVWHDGDAFTRWWDPQIFFLITAGTVVIVGAASLYKWSQLRGGGSAVAEMVGGRLIEPGRATPDERRLLNVVEEMAIASGVPIPAVYVLDQEPALNAFAAGLSTNDAVVAVTRGTLEKLNRDELQGVIGHEFSHILNGDMRLNVKLTSILFGILVIGLIGRGILYSLSRGRMRVSGGGKNKGGGIAVIFVLGLVLITIGYIGYFFGRLIQAAVSRQREFLADASAVQFTRNPAGITGALKKIGGYALGSNIIDNHSAEIGHFFFAQGFRSMFGGAWATHPPLAQRIRAIDPQWDGQNYKPEQVVDITKENFKTAGFDARQRLAQEETLRRASAASTALPPPLITAPIPFIPAAIVADVGALTDTHFRQAQLLLQAIPAGLRTAGADALQAQVVVYGLLLGSADTERQTQQTLIAKLAGDEAVVAFKALRPALSLLDPAARLPLLLLCAPALRTLDTATLDRFVTTLDELVFADGKVSTFEFVLQKVLTRQLQLGGAPSPKVEFTALDAMTGDISVALSALARVGSNHEAEVATAFLAGAGQLKSIATELSLRSAEQSGYEALDTALNRLAVSSLPIKKRLLSAAAYTIGHDGSVTVEEGELFRAIAIAIDCPVPLLSGATAE